MSGADNFSFGFEHPCTEQHLRSNAGRFLKDAASLQVLVALRANGNPLMNYRARRRLYSHFGLCDTPTGCYVGKVDRGRRLEAVLFRARPQESLDEEGKLTLSCEGPDFLDVMYLVHQFDEDCLPGAFENVLADGCEVRSTRLAVVYGGTVPEGEQYQVYLVNRDGSSEMLCEGVSTPDPVLAEYQVSP